MPKKKEYENIFSPLLLDYPKENAEWNNDKIEEDFKELMILRDLVLKKLEKARADKKIGQSLEAKVLIYFRSENENNDSIEKEIKNIEKKANEYISFLPDLFITSMVEILDDKKVEKGDNKEILDLFNEEKDELNDESYISKLEKNIFVKIVCLRRKQMCKMLEIWRRW